MIAERLVQPGEFIAEKTPVATIVQMHPLKLRTALQEKYAGAIAPGQIVEFRVEAFPDRRFTARMAYVSPAVDQTTRTFAVEAIVENGDRQLKPGFFAKGVVNTRVDHEVVAVPEEVVSNLAGVTTVYVIDEGKARQVQITTGQRVGPLLEVVSGLKGTERLAATNLNQLATGTPVEVVGREKAAATAGASRPDGSRP
jgi:membrane fusion protein (multidrug efflux system)